jgi:hypothetical protein
LRHFCTKIIFLPRQARDKHRDNSKKDAFLQGEPIMRPMFYDFPSDPKCASGAASDQVRKRGFGSLLK